MAKDISVALTLDNKQFNSAISQSQKRVKSFTSDTEKGASKVAGAFKGLIAAFGVGQIVSLTDAFTNLNNRLRAVTDSEEEAAKALQLVQQVASDTRSDIEATANLFADLTLATESYGTTQEQVAQITETFSKALAVSGSTGTAAAGAILQFGQALTGGVLRGQEFNSITAANSKFMGEFAKQLGVSRGQLRKMAEQGKLTADVVIKATQDMADEVDESFNKTIAGTGAQLTKLRNSIILLFGQLEKESGVMGNLNTIIGGLADAIRYLATNEEAVKRLVIALGSLAAIIGAGLGLSALRGSMTLLERSLKGLAGKAGKRGLTGTFKALGNNLKGFVGISGKIVEHFKKFGNTSSILGRVMAGLYQIIFRVAGLFTNLGRILLFFVGKGGWIGLIVVALDLLLKKFTGFSILDWVIDKFKTLGKWIASVTRSLFGMEEAAEAAGAAASSTDDLSDSLSDANTFADAAAEGMARFDRQLREAKGNAAGFLEDFKAGKFNTELENAKKRMETARNTVNTLRTAIMLLNPDSANAAEELRLLTEQLEAAEAALADASTEVNNLEKSFDDLVKDMSEGIAEDFSVEDLQKEFDRFDMSDVQKQIEEFNDSIDDAFEERRESLADAIGIPGLPAETKTALEAMLAQLDAKKEEAKRKGKEFILGLAGKEQTKVFNDLAKELEGLTTPEGIDAFKLKIQDLYNTLGIGEEHFNRLREEADKAKASLGAEAGIGQAIKELSKSFTPFQMAVDATTMVWGHMSSAIDQFVENGKASFSDFAKSVLKDLAKMILKQMIFNALVGGLTKLGGTSFGKAIGLDKVFPGKATGGPVERNKPYMIGEQGPELFVPNASGTVVPNNRLGDMSGAVSAPVTNNYITNNINAMDSRSVAQVFAENRQTLLGTVEYARKETAYGV